MPLRSSVHLGTWPASSHLSTKQTKHETQDHTIFLEAGTCTLTTVDNTFGQGANGFPVIRSGITIQGAGTSETEIMRDESAPDFRFFHIVENAGGPSSLTLRQLSLRGGKIDGFGGAISNNGSLRLEDTFISDNVASGSGGAISRGVYSVAGPVSLSKDRRSPQIRRPGAARSLLRAKEYLQLFPTAPLSVTGQQKVQEASTSPVVQANTLIIENSVLYGNEGGSTGAFFSSSVASIQST